MGAKMKFGSVLSILTLVICMNLLSEAYAYKGEVYINPSNPYLSTSSRYDYLYANPPRQSLGAYGRYIYSNSRTRYIHSPSRLKGVRHAARINANNLQAYGY